ncbi:hypothetical protein [Streptomyces sp. PR69]|uniref:hypothetical protein n=1 Tax=Streptomyces sp. PR69 TaxID=2984950 RepID=UPI002263D130|nr:hypothetical protein [Streptomyces sp. PR69]
MSASEPSVALELERLRGAVDTGFAKLNGRLDVALQRTSQTETDIEELKQEVEALKRARWPLPSLAAVTGLAALGLTLYEISAR